MITAITPGATVHGRTHEPREQRKRVRGALSALATALVIASAVAACAGTWTYTAQQAPCARQCMMIHNQCTAGAANYDDALVRLAALIDCEGQRDECYTSCGMTREP
jgi:hypothetical protein